MPSYTIPQEGQYDDTKEDKGKARQDKTRQGKKQEPKERARTKC